MWTPSSFSVNFSLALLSLTCWGSWGNTAKAQPDRPFPLFYLSWTAGVFATALIFFLTFGGGQVWSDEAEDIDSHDASVIWAALAAGAIFDAANVLLVLGIQLYGLAVAFPVGIGTALVLGTLLTYFESRAAVLRPDLLCWGVSIAFVAICCQVRAKAVVDGVQLEVAAAAEADSHFSMSTFSSAPSGGSDTEKAPILPKGDLGSSGSFRSGVAVCGLCGLLMSLWAPLEAKSMASPGGLTPYASFLCFAFAMLFVSPAICVALHRWPVRRDDNSSSATTRPTSRRPSSSDTNDGHRGAAALFRTFVSSSWLEHQWGLLGGAVWATGTAANLVSGASIGLALSYAIGQAAPMVATSWGLFYYKEFDISAAKVFEASAGRTSMARAISLAARKTWLTNRWVTGMYLCYIAAILLIASSR